VNGKERNHGDMLDTLQLKLGNVMQAGQFMAVVNEFMADRQRIAESNAAINRWIGSREGSDTEVDEDGPY
jgi:hypothetical protein